jgi:hypothetical protein
VGAANVSNEYIYYIEKSPLTEVCFIPSQVKWWEKDPIGFDLLYPLPEHKAFYLQGERTSAAFYKTIMLASALQNSHNMPKQDAVEEVGNGLKNKSYNDLPDNAQNAYNGYESNGWKGNYSGQAPGTHAGGNYQNSNGHLPTVDPAGNAITYREFDVNAPIAGIGRDTQRFVVGSDGSVYFTDSHYGQCDSPSGLPEFIQIK